MMNLKDCTAGRLCWYKFSDTGKMLVRVRYVGRDYVSCMVAAATPEQVIESGYAIGEPVNLLPVSLEAIEKEK